jgi:uncharacterized protein
LEAKIFGRSSIFYSIEEIYQGRRIHLEAYAIQEQVVALSGEEQLREKFGTPDIPITTFIPRNLARYLETFDFFFIATSNSKGECDASFRGRRGKSPGIKIVDEKTIIFPDYLGNGSFKSLGNILENPHIGMLFIDLKTGLRIRINGEAQVVNDPQWLSVFPDSIQLVKVNVTEAYKQNRPVSMGKSFGR